eukprot:1156569-Prorocentrum_minimum.AAC.1
MPGHALHAHPSAASSLGHIRLRAGAHVTPPHPLLAPSSPPPHRMTSTSPPSSRGTPDAPSTPSLTCACDPSSFPPHPLLTA